VSVVHTIQAPLYLRT